MFWPFSSTTLAVRAKPVGRCSIASVGRLLSSATVNVLIALTYCCVEQFVLELGDVYVMLQRSRDVGGGPVTCMSCCREAETSAADRWRVCHVAEKPRRRRRTGDVYVMCCRAEASAADRRTCVSCCRAEASAADRVTFLPVAGPRRRRRTVGRVCPVAEPRRRLRRRRLGPATGHTRPTVRRRHLGSATGQTRPTVRRQRLGLATGQTRPTVRRRRLGSATGQSRSTV